MDRGRPAAPPRPRRAAKGESPPEGAPASAASRRIRRAIIGTYLLFASCYSVLTPIGEAPDELSHYTYARLVQDQRRLPAARDQQWQGHQAPAYYLILAAGAGALDALGCRIDPARLPARLTPAVPGSRDENWLQHASTERLTAWGCQELAFHLLRLISIAMTALMLALAFRVLERVFPSSPDLVAIAGSLVALVPTQVCASAMLNNDALANLLVVGATYLTLVAWERGTLRSASAAWCAAALAMGAKLSGLYLFALVALVALWRRRPLRELAAPGAWKPLAAAGVLSLVPTAVLARNLAEWGDPFAVAALEWCRALLIEAGANPRHASAGRYYLAELPALLLFQLPVAYGAINRRGGPWLAHAAWYVPLVLAGLAVSALPLARSVWPRVARGPFLILLAGLALFLATFLYPSYRYRWLQARYFASQLPVLAALAAVGLAALGQLALGGRRKPGVGWTLAAVHYGWLVALNALVLATAVIPNLYRHVGAPD